MQIVRFVDGQNAHPNPRRELRRACFASWPLAEQSRHLSTRRVSSLVAYNFRPEQRIRCCRCFVEPIDESRSKLGGFANNRTAAGYEETAERHLIHAGDFELQMEATPFEDPLKGEPDYSALEPFEGEGSDITSDRGPARHGTEGGSECFAETGTFGWRGDARSPVSPSPVHVRLIEIAVQGVIHRRQRAENRIRTVHGEVPKHVGVLGPIEIRWGFDHCPGT